MCHMVITAVITSIVSIITTIVFLSQEGLAVEITTKSLYIKVGDWDYWKQWASPDIN
jgi:hypothetical protein